jgi:hypothetical protein
VGSNNFWREFGEEHDDCLQRSSFWDYWNLREEVEPLQSEIALSPQEAQELRELEDTIQESFESFLKTGLAFARIRFLKLYRATHDTFESYCHDRWGLSLSRTNQIIGSVKVIENITQAFPQDATLLEETSKCAFRSLATLEPPLQSAVWELVKSIEERPSGRTIEEVVETIRGAIQDGWQARGDATQESVPVPSGSRNGTSLHRAHGCAHHRQSDLLAGLSRWVNRVTTWDPTAIAQADDELRLKAHLRAARQLQAFCAEFIQALESRLSTTS